MCRVGSWGFQTPSELWNVIGCLEGRLRAVPLDGRASEARLTKSTLGAHREYNCLLTKLIVEKVKQQTRKGSNEIVGCSCTFGKCLGWDRSDNLGSKERYDGGKSGSHPDYSNKHTRTLINWICLSAFYTNDLFLSFLAHFDGQIPCKGFTTMLQSHLYQYDQVTLTAIDYLRMILKTAVSAGYRKIKIR